MIGISTQAYDTEGARLFRNTTRARDLENRSGERRISRTGTLDGGVLIADMGYADGDRDITIEESAPSIEAVDFARYIVEHYTIVNVMTEHGAFSAVPASYGIKNGILTIVLMVTEKQSE